jgi:hypothetical protein
VTEVIHLEEGDDLPVLRDRLRRAQAKRVILHLSWDCSPFSRLLDYELLQREAERLGLEVAFVSPDPDRRGLVRQAGFGAFSTMAEAEAESSWPRPAREKIESPPTPFWEWEEKTSLQPPPKRILPRWIHRIRRGVRVSVFLVTILTLLISGYVILPRANVTIIPTGQTVSVIVPVSAGREIELIDTAEGIVPARRVGDYFEGSIDVETTGTTARQSGRASGTVLFTNLLAQEVVVPARTVVRTSAGGFPIRFATTQAVTVPPLGQAPAPVEALSEGPVGNVGTNQINRVEGVASLALRVTNPEPITGGSAQEVQAVSQEDMDRARELLTAQLLDRAHGELQVYLESTEFIPRQSLTVQAAETAYDRFLTEQADTLGLHMRLLITGLAVDRDNAEAVAYARLARSLPSGYELVGADFELGEMAEEPIGSGDLAFFVTARGYAAAHLEPQVVRRVVLGKPVSRAAERLDAELPLAESPQIEVWPEWFPWMPVLPMRISVDVIPQEHGAGDG